MLRFKPIETGDLCWIFGVGRSGSTWLAELLDGLHNTRLWHEPYFGSVLAHPTNLRTEFERDDCLFAKKYDRVWHLGLRHLLLSAARARFGRISRFTKVVIKDINAPQICPHFSAVFPDSRYLLLVREPFDILDSHIGMTTPDSWNRFATPDHTAEHFALHIRQSLETAIEGYRRVPEGLRLIVRYSDMIADPVAELRKCVDFLQVPARHEEVEETVKAHSFSTHKDTGAGSFRRFGKVGIWKESGNFDREVLQTAEK